MESIYKTNQNAKLDAWMQRPSTSIFKRSSLEDHGREYFIEAKIDN
jgi:hypothetical protein